MRIWTSPSLPAKILCACHSSRKLSTVLTERVELCTPTLLLVRQPNGETAGSRTNLDGVVAHAVLQSAKSVVDTLITASSKKFALNAAQAFSCRSCKKCRCWAWKQTSGRGAYLESSSQWLLGCKHKCRAENNEWTRSVGRKVDVSFTSVQTIHPTMLLSACAHVRGCSSPAYQPKRCRPFSAFP